LSYTALTGELVLIKARGYWFPVIVVRICGIARRTPKRKLTTLHNPNTPFLFIKLLRKHLNSNLLSFIFIIPYFLRIQGYIRLVFENRYGGGFA
jgi:hypothetical protein